MRRDLSIGFKERFVQVGFVFLLVLFAYVMYNDVIAHASDAFLTSSTGLPAGTATARQEVATINQLTVYLAALIDYQRSTSLINPTNHILKNQYAGFDQFQKATNSTMKLNLWRLWEDEG